MRLGRQEQEAKAFNDLPHCRQETLITFYWKNQHSTPRRAEVSLEKLQQKDDFWSGTFLWPELTSLHLPWVQSLNLGCAGWLGYVYTRHPKTSHFLRGISSSGCKNSAAPKCMIKALLVTVMLLTKNTQWWDCGTEQTSFMQSDISLFLLLLFGKGPSPSLTSISAAFYGEKSPKNNHKQRKSNQKHSTNNKQCNLGNNIMQHQVESNRGLKKSLLI